MKKIAILVIISLISVGITLVTLGEEEKVPAEKNEGKAPAPALSELTLIGKVDKTEKETDQKSVALYTLTDAEGNIINLPLSKDNPPKYNLDDFVGKNVKVVGQGFTHENKETNKKRIELKTITSIEEVKEEENIEEANP